MQLFLSKTVYTVMDTIYINLFAGPGTGKSTTAAGIFYKLKHKGYNAELIQEYAKDRVWQEDYQTLKFQPYVLGKQLYRQFRVKDKVEVAVTDSPVLFSLLYKGFGCVEGFDEVVLRQFNLFNNLNIYLERNLEDHPYNPKGRYQTQEEAVALDAKNLELLGSLGVQYHKVRLDKNDKYIDEIIQLFIDKFKKQSDEELEFKKKHPHAVHVLSEPATMQDFINIFGWAEEEMEEAKVLLESVKEDHAAEDNETA